MNCACGSKRTQHSPGTPQDIPRLARAQAITLLPTEKHMALVSPPVRTRNDHTEVILSLRRALCESGAATSSARLLHTSRTEHTEHLSPRDRGDKRLRSDPKRPLTQLSPHPTTCTGRARTASPSDTQGHPRALLAAPLTLPSPKESAHVAGAAAGSPPSSQTNAQSTVCCRARTEQTEQCERVRRSRSMQSYGLPRSSYRICHCHQLPNEAHPAPQCSRRPPAA